MAEAVHRTARRWAEQPQLLCDVRVLRSIEQRLCLTLRDAFALPQGGQTPMPLLASLKLDLIVFKHEASRLRL